MYMKPKYNIAMKRYYVIFTGMVQGVGFRWTILMLARKYNFTGWVRNMDNGNVEIEVQGHNLNIAVFIVEVIKGARYARIEDYSIKEIPVRELEYGFDVKG